MPFPPARPPRRQRGAVLVVSLILLVVLTLLGVASMNTTQLEEKMAANTQISALAFHAAETGVSEMFDNNAAWVVDEAGYDAIVGTGDGPDPLTDPDAQADLRTDYLGQSAPPLGSLYSASSFTAYHFDFVAAGCTLGTVADGNADGVIADDCASNGGLVTVVHGGAYQIAPNPN